MSLFSKLIFTLFLLPSVVFSQEDYRLKSIAEFERGAPTMMISFHTVNAHPIGEMGLETKGENGFGFDGSILFRPLKSKLRLLYGLAFTTSAYSIGTHKTVGQSTNYIIRTAHRTSSFQFVLRYAFPSKYLFKPYVDLNYGFNRLISQSNVGSASPFKSEVSNNQGIGFGGGFYIAISRVINLDIAVNIQTGGTATYSHRNATTLVNGNDVDYGDLSSKAGFLYLRMGVMKAF